MTSSLGYVGGSPREWEAWDRELEADSEAGQLEFLVDEALRESLERGHRDAAAKRGQFVQVEEKATAKPQATPVYGIVTHRHRFALWAAARAAQRGFSGGTLRNLSDALEQCGVCGLIRAPSALATRAEAFEELHRQWCTSICDSLRKRGAQGVTYGRAAKLVAIYLKTMVIISGSEGSELARAIHPPVDNILLTRLAGAAEVQSRHKSAWRGTKWTQLDARRYYALIAQLRTALPEQPFWMCEKYWTATGD